MKSDLQAVYSLTDSLNYMDFNNPRIYNYICTNKNSYSQILYNMIKKYKENNLD